MTSSPSSLRSPSLPLVELILNRRHVTVKGKRGTLERNFKHAQLELVYEEIKEEGKPTKKQLRVDSWFANKKVWVWGRRSCKPLSSQPLSPPPAFPQQLAQIRTVCSSIENMIKGVKYGYRYAMKSVYAHFPINLTFEGGGNKSVQVRNFLGEKVVRNVAMLDGVTVRASGEKDEIFVEVCVVGCVMVVCVCVCVCPYFD